QDSMCERHAGATDERGSKERKDQDGKRQPFGLMKIGREPFLNIFLHRWTGQGLERIGEHAHSVGVERNDDQREDKNNEERTDRRLETRDWSLKGLRFRWLNDGSVGRGGDEKGEARVWARGYVLDDVGKEIDGENDNANCISAVEVDPQ